LVTDFKIFALDARKEIRATTTLAAGPKARQNRTLFHLFHFITPPCRHHHKRHLDAGYFELFGGICGFQLFRSMLALITAVLVRT
jgi:hypothetical protein